MKIIAMNKNLTHNESSLNTGRKKGKKGRKKPHNWNRLHKLLNANLYAIFFNYTAMNERAKNAKKQS